MFGKVLIKQEGNIYLSFLLPKYPKKGDTVHSFPCNAFPHFILHFSPFSFLLYYSERKPFDFFITVILDFLNDSLIFHLILRGMSKGVESTFPSPFFIVLTSCSLSLSLLVVLRLNFIFTLKLFRSVIECNYWHSDAFNAAFLGW